MEYKKILAKDEDQGAHTLATRVGGAPPRARPLPRGPPGGSPMTIFCYMKSFVEKKLEATFRDETPPPRGGTLAEPI